MNKQSLGLIPLFALICLVACNAPRAVEESPLKTVEQTRLDAHRTTNSDAKINQKSEDSIDSNNAATMTPKPSISVSDIPLEEPKKIIPNMADKVKKEMSAAQKTTTDEFTEKSVPFTGEAPAYLQTEEFEMITEVNLMRSNPQGYISYVEEYIEQVNKDERLDQAYRTEEVATAQELINELKTLEKLSILKPHEGLYKVGIKHGKDIQQQGMIGHRGSDGTMPWDRVRNSTDLKDGNENLVGGGESVREQVMILLVDSGIPGRGHRKTLLESKWTHLACHKIGEIGGIPNNWIQVFGNE